MKELPVRARVYVAATWVLAAFALALSAAARPDWLLVAALSAITIVVDRARPGLRIQGGAIIGLHMTLPMAVAAGLLGGPAEACLVGALSAFAGGSTATYKRVFNGAQFALSAAAAGLVLALMGAAGVFADAARPAPSAWLMVIVSVLFASVAYCLVNAALLTVVLLLVDGTRPREVLFGTIAETAPSYVGYGLLGLLFAVLWNWSSAFAAVLVLLPLLVARWAWLQFAKQQEAYESTIRTLVRAVEMKDHYTRGHSERVSKASVMIARVLGMREDRVNALRYAGILHDVGKLGVPTKILQKAGGLTDDESAMIQTHPLRGTEMLQDIEFLDEAFRGILHHHERLDGLGYPAGLRGQEIPEFARVIAVADAFDSMTSTRSYRGARTPLEAMGELERCRGSQFDPLMVDALVQALKREPWKPTRLDPPTDSASVAAIDHDDPTVDVGIGVDRGIGGDR